jgi:hypothetical protein
MRATLTMTLALPLLLGACSHSRPALSAGVGLPGRGLFAPSPVGPDAAAVNEVASLSGLEPLLTIPAGTDPAVWRQAVGQAVAAARKVKPDAHFAAIARADGPPDQAAAQLTHLAPGATEVAAALTADGAGTVTLGASSAPGPSAILVFAR